MQLPSKELLSIVLKYKVVNISHNGLTDGKIHDAFMIHINPSQRMDKPSSCIIPKESINIHVLTDKIIDWICNIEQERWLCKSFYIQTDGTSWYASFAKIKSICKDNYIFEDITKCETKHEAIFKAGEWILKQLKKCDTMENIQLKAC